MVAVVLGFVGAAVHLVAVYLPSSMSPGRSRQSDVGGWRWSPSLAPPLFGPLLLHQGVIAMKRGLVGITMLVAAGFVAGCSSTTASSSGKDGGGTGQDGTTSADGSKFGKDAGGRAARRTAEPAPERTGERVRAPTAEALRRPRAAHLWPRDDFVSGRDGDRELLHEPRGDRGKFDRPRTSAMEDFRCFLRTELPPGWPTQRR